MSKQEIDICEEVRLMIAKKYRTQSEAAKHWGFSTAYISAILAGNKKMPAWMAKEAGFTKVEKWVRIK